MLVLRLKRARNPDAVGMTLLEGFLERMEARGVHVLLCGVRAEFARQARARSASPSGSASALFLEQPVRQTSTALAIRHAYALIPERCAICPARGAPDTDRGFHYVI